MLLPTGHTNIIIAHACLLAQEFKNLPNLIHAKYTHIHIHIYVHIYVCVLIICMCV